MTSSPPSGSGSHRLRDIRHLYPSVTENHLRYLEKWGLVRAGARSAGEYSFTDVLTIKHVASELGKGTPLRTILRSLLAERQGQLELDFHTGHASADAPRAKVLALEAHRSTRSDAVRTAVPAARGNTAPFPFPDPQAALAAKYFTEGSRFDDGDDRKMEDAASAYRKALVIDPDLVPAIVNLANIHYARDELIEAQALYERAISLDSDCFEAHFNLGNILHDLGRYAGALGCYRDAVSLNPRYADAHFYLAVTLEKLGYSSEAKVHWKTYLELAPDGEWADLAREFLE